MRIGIDYSIAVRPGAGITRYTRELVQGLTQIDSDSEYILLWPGLDADAEEVERAVPKTPNVRSVRLPLTFRALTILWHRLGLPLYADLLTGWVQVFHCPDFALAPLHRAKGVVTIHDLSFLRFPEFTDASLLSYLHKVVPDSVRRAELVLADSNATREDVINWLNVDPGRVQVVYAGVHQRFRPVENAQALLATRARYRLPDRFVLAVGTVQPRKNLTRLIEAFGQIAHHEDVQLIIVGRLGWLFDSTLQRVAELQLQDHVRFLGFVPDDDLPALYSLASCFAFPSVYEGFGLPPLEAMACGTPVVSSNVSSMPEVLGTAALFIDPYDVDALAEALRQVLADPELQRTMSQAGLEQVKAFSWTAAAQRLLTVYRSLASQSR